MKIKFFSVFAIMAILSQTSASESAHYFSFGLFAGPSFSGEFYKGINIGGSIDYMYQPNGISGIGAGITASGTVMKYSLSRTIPVNNLGVIQYKYEYFTGSFFSVVPVLALMLGDLEKKAAFLFDIGGGWLFAVKTGIMISGFAFKAGYILAADTAYFDLSHNFIFEFGYKFKFKIKKGLYNE